MERRPWLTPNTQQHVGLDSASIGHKQSGSPHLIALHLNEDPPVRGRANEGGETHKRRPQKRCKSDAAGDVHGEGLVWAWLCPYTSPRGGSEASGKTRVSGGESRRDHERGCKGSPGAGDPRGGGGEQPLEGGRGAQRVRGRGAGLAQPPGRFAGSSPSPAPKSYSFRLRKPSTCSCGFF